MTMKVSKQSIADARNTPVDDSYPSCDRTCAELRIYPSVHTAKDVSVLMEITPSESGEAGELRETSRGTNRTIKMTHWVLSSETHVDSKDLRVHLNWLLDRIEPRLSILEALASTSGTKMTIVCVWWSAIGHGGPTLWPEQLLRLSRLGLEMGFDIQFHDRE